MLQPPPTITILMDALLTIDAWSFDQIMRSNDTPWGLFLRSSLDDSGRVAKIKTFLSDNADAAPILHELYIICQQYFAQTMNRTLLYRLKSHVAFAAFLTDIAVYKKTLEVGQPSTLALAIWDTPQHTDFMACLLLDAWRSIEDLTVIGIMDCYPQVFQLQCARTKIRWNLYPTLILNPPQTTISSHIDHIFQLKTQQRGQLNKRLLVMANLTFTNVDLLLSDWIRIILGYLTQLETWAPSTSSSPLDQYPLLGLVTRTKRRARGRRRKTTRKPDPCSRMPDRRYNDTRAILLQETHYQMRLLYRTTPLECHPAIFQHRIATQKKLWQCYHTILMQPHVSHATSATMTNCEDPQTSQYKTVLDVKGQTVLAQLNADLKNHSPLPYFIDKCVSQVQTLIGVI